MVVCECGCECVDGCELSFLAEQVPPLHVRDRCSSGEQEGKSVGAEVQGRSTNWSKLLSTHRSSFDMMYSLLNYSTHIKHFCKPLSGTSAIFLTAKQDSYVPREDCVTSVWPGEAVLLLLIAGDVMHTAMLEFMFDCKGAKYDMWMAAMLQRPF